jgi:hypothetical protein
MHGLVLEVSIDPARGDEALKLLNEVVVPAVSSAPGLVAAYWLGGPAGGRGTSVVIFESEEAARQAADSGPRPPEGAPVTITRVEVMEVVAHV